MVLIGVNLFENSYFIIKTHFKGVKLIQTKDNNSNLTKIKVILV